MTNKLLNLLLAAMGAMLGGTATAQVQLLLDQPSEDNTYVVMLYAPDERSGLHIAYFGNGQWNAMGQLCASDYGTWGAEKKMYAPSVARTDDGTWRAVWQVNDHSPVFAAAYSRDLITWRPQDYPRVATRQCLSPVVLAAGNAADIYYRSAEGKRYVRASDDFRRFEPAVACEVDDDLWIRDTVEIGGKLVDGNRFEITADELMAIARHLDAQHEDQRLCSERMHDDAKRLSTLTSPMKGTLTVSTANRKPISDKLIGVFFEDISYAADGGLYAELVQNRDFEYSGRDHKGWSAATAWSQSGPLRIETRQPLSANNPHYVVLRHDTLYNEGWGGMAVEGGALYDFSMYVCLPSGGKKQFVVSLIDADGQVLAQDKLKAQGTGWTSYSATLKPRRSEANARLALVALKDVEAAVDMVSLFPRETFMGRKNGLRRDLAQAIADLKPKFVRFPGGCMSHGQGLANIYHWQETIGPLYDRKPDMNIWHYHQTRGLGFYEYFQFCEDIGAEPLPVLAAGVPCQNSANDAEGYGGQQGGIPMSQMPAYIDELLHLIEWANGDPATSPWARKRAEAGHPEPFHLKYIGIGNEDIISTVFEERYAMICKAIRQKYPDIKVCGTVGPFHSPSADYQEGWDFTRRNPGLQYMVDEHYYESTGWFLHHRNYYDRYDRQGAKVYLGEWAASTKAKRPNVETALAEAIYLTDIERNADVVVMTSYAPLLCKEGNANWNPDMIYFNNTSLRTTPAYDVQRLFSNASGNEYIATHLAIADQQLSHRVAASLVANSTTGEQYLKLVNALPVPLQLSLEGLSLPEGTQAEGFEGKPEEQRTQCHVVSLPAGRSVELPPYSLRVIKVNNP